MKYTIEDFLNVKHAVAPSFSPDGSHIAYRTNVSGTYQIYLVPQEGGEPRQLTSYADPIESAAFSPTENKILFSKAEGGNEQFQLYILDVPSGEVKQLTHNPKVRYDMGNWSRDGKYINYSSNERNGTDLDVFVMEVSTGKITCIYDRGGRCAPTAFSPRMTYTIIKEHYSLIESSLYLYNFKTGEITALTKRNPHEMIEYSGIRWLPDESGFYLMTNKGRDFVGIAHYNLEEKNFLYVIQPEWDVDGILFSRDGKYLGAEVNEDGYSKLYLYDTSSFTKIEHENFSKGNIGSFSISTDSKYIAYGFSDSRHVGNIRIYSINDGRDWQVTNSLQTIPPEILAEPKLIHYTSFDGKNIPAFVYESKDISGKKPAIIHIHGGPESQARAEFSSVIQYFAYIGYIVITPNVRGSTGYGKAYTMLDDREKRMDSVKDIVALRNHLSSLPHIDTSKIVPMGGSYGGFMVLACLTFFPDLWAAGIDIVGISNFITFLQNTAPYRRALREVEYGYLDTQKEFLKSISPFYFIENIRVPLLVIHGANDPRVSLSEAEQIVTRLTELARDVELIVYPDEGHGIRKHKNIIDVFPRVAKFLERVQR